MKYNKKLIIEGSIEKHLIKGSIEKQLQGYRDIPGWALIGGITPTPTEMQYVLGLYEDFDEVFKYCLHHFWTCVYDSYEGIVGDLSLLPEDAIVFSKPLYKSFKHVDEKAMLLEGRCWRNSWVVYSTIEGSVLDLFPIASFDTAADAIKYCEEKDWSNILDTVPEQLIIVQSELYILLYEGHIDY
jgi:hypothetical protein